MSVRLMSKIWDHAVNVTHERLIVLLALADWANDDGECWPKIATIATKARITERGVKGILAWLENEGYLTIQHGKGRGNSSHYLVHYSPVKGEPVAPFKSTLKGEAESIKGEAGSIKGEADDIEKVKLKALKGEPENIAQIRYACAEPSEPSVRTISEPSGGTPPQKNQSPEKRPNIDSPLAMELRKVCKRGIILSENDRQKMQQALMILEAENATVAQMQEFGRKVKLHWIGRDSKTKQPRAPGILQVAENWKDVLDIDENAAEIITGGQNANIPRMPTRVAHDDASLRRYAAKKQAEAQAL